MTGHPRYARQPWHRREKTDTLVAGRENGQVGCGERRLCAGQHAGPGPFAPARRSGGSRMRQGFEDRASGARADRAGLQAALDYVRDGEVLVVWKLDRLGRSLPHLIETVTALSNRGVGFRSLTEAIDTTTPGGRLIFHIFGALGQFERDLIQERTRAGLAAATVRGRKSGRKPVITGDKLKRARGMVSTGLTVREIATRLKVGKTALYEALRAEPD